MNKEGQRIFPRYSLKHISNELFIPEMKDSHNIKTIDIGLGGICFETPNDSQFPDAFEFEITLLGKNKYKLNAKKVWQKGNNIGCRFNFTEKENFEKWLQFVKAIHLLNLKHRVETNG